MVGARGWGKRGVSVQWGQFQFHKMKTGGWMVGTAAQKYGCIEHHRAVHLEMVNLVKENKQKHLITCCSVLSKIQTVFLVKTKNPL